MKFALFFLSLSGILIFSWFRYGYVYGGGDVGLPTYDPARISEITKYIWWEAAAPGALVPNSLVSSPLAFLLSPLQLIGFSPVALQAVLFLTLLFLMGFGMYLLTSSILGKDARNYAILAGLFYMFNPYMMIQVWHRFIHTTFFLAAFLPFIFLFFRNFIKTGKYSYLLLFLTINLLGVYLYGTIAYIVTIWLLLLLVTLYEVFIPWQNKENAIKIFFRFLLSLLFWILINSWWLVPTFSVGSSLFSKQHSNEESLITLLEISRQAALPFSLQLVNPFYLFETAELGDIYKNPVFKLIPWIFINVVFLGIFKSLQNRKIAFFGLLFIVALFFSKGAATPFGHPFILAFTNLFFVGILRNPFEKLGILLPFAGSILFCVGLMIVFNIIQKFFNRFIAKLAVLFFVVLVVGFSWPMISGKIFGSVTNPAFVKVPKSYSEADNWLNLQKKDGNILHLPLTRNEGGTYNWEYGYGGVEPSQLLFTSNPSISRGFNIYRIDDSLTGLSLLFDKPYSENQDVVLKNLQNFNIRFIVLHKDIEWKGGDLYNPVRIDENLKKMSFLQEKVSFGDVSIYELESNFFLPKISIDKGKIVTPENGRIRMWPYLQDENQAFVTPLKDTVLSENLLNRETFVFAKNTFSSPEASGSATNSLVSQLMYTQNFTSNSMLYNLVVIKQYLDRLGVNKSKFNVADEIISASQNLTKIYQSINSNQKVNLEMEIIEYTNHMQNIFILSEKDFKFYSYLKEPDQIFQIHYLILKNLKSYFNKEEADTIERSVVLIENYLKSKDLLPLNQFIGNSGQSIRQVQVFDVPKDGKYELLLTGGPYIQAAYVNKLNELNFQINNKIVSLKGINNDSFTAFGEAQFKKGINEISIITANSVNLLASDRASSGEGIILNDNVTSYESSIKPILGEDLLQISFETSIDSGQGFYIHIFQDSDAIEREGKPKIGFAIPKGSQTGWINYTLTFPKLSLTTREASIKFSLPPQGIFGNNVVKLRNIRLTRVLDNALILKSNPIQENVTVQDIGQIKEIIRKSPVEYEGRVDILNPGFFIFKETFHTDWELKLSNGGKDYYPSIHILGNLYGNAWYVDNPGEYEFKLYFKPQKNVNMGLILLLISMTVVALLYLRQKRYENK